MENGEPSPVTGELEAADALAGLARSSSLRRRPLVDVVSAAHSQDQLVPSTAMIPENPPTQMCSTSNQPNPPTKRRPKLTQAEKEARKVRRILANRESARETIRRRKALHVELTKKAAEASEENERLKKEKEMALKKYNSLKNTYEIFKARLDEVKRAAAGEPETEILGPSTPTTSNPAILHNQPSMIPCFWPPILPSSFQYPSCHSHNKSLSQFPMPHGDLPCSSHQGQEHSMGSTAPLLVYPVPWLLPFIPHGCNDRMNTCSRCSCPDSRPHEDTNQLPSPLLPFIPHGCNDRMNTCSRCSCPDSRPHEDTNQLPSPQNTDQQDARLPPGHITVPGLFSPVRPLDTSRPPSGCQVDDTCNINASSTPEDRMLHRNKELMKPEDALAITMARKRRKELMKLKNVPTLNLQFWV